MDLAKKSCKACQGETKPLDGLRSSQLLKELSTGWNLNAAGHLIKEFRFKDFKTALGFVNQIGALAEAEGHHPNMHFTWGYVKVELWTHKLKGLSESDFIMAAKIDRL